MAEIGKQEIIDQINALTVGDNQLTEEEQQYLINWILAGGKLTANPRDLIQIRRGMKENLPTLAQGELGVTLDEEGLYVGGLNGNIKLPSKQELDNVNMELTERGVNVKSLGAIGDGVTDDYEVIQFAIDNYDYVFIPDGTYAVSKEIRVRKKCSIEGSPNKPYLKMTSKFTTLIRVMANDVTIRSLKLGNVIAPDGAEEFECGCIMTNGYNNGLYEDLIIDVSDDSGIRVGYEMVGSEKRPSEYNVIRNCYFTGVTEGSAVELIRSNYTIVENCVFENNPADRWAIRNVDSHHNSIRGCTFDRNYIAIGMLTGSGGEGSRDIEITDCTFDNSVKHHIRLSGSEVRITNCNFKNTGSQTEIAMLIQTTAVGTTSIKDINVRGCIFTGFMTVIRMNTRCDNVIISGCIASNFQYVSGSGSSSYNFLHLQGSSGESFGNIYLMNNVISDDGAYPYQYILFAGIPVNEKYFLRAYSNDYVLPNTTVSNPQCRSETYRGYIRYSNDVFNGVEFVPPDPPPETP